MNTITSYEIKALAFYKMTGHMAPGKDAPMESYPASFDERYIAWVEWLTENKIIINAMMAATNEILDLDNEDD